MKDLAGKSKLEMVLCANLEQSPLPSFCQQYRFAREIVGDGPGIRKRLRDAGLQDWVFDLACPEYKVAVEVQGGTYSGGAHVRGKGYENDCKKGNAARLAGWQVYAFTGAMVYSGEALLIIGEALQQREAKPIREEICERPVIVGVDGIKRALKALKRIAGSKARGGLLEYVTLAADALGDLDWLEKVLQCAVIRLRDGLSLFDGTLELCDDVGSDEWVWSWAVRYLLDDITDGVE